MPSRAFIELGSNLEAELHLPRAAAALTSLGRVVDVSQVYRTKPYGPAGQPDFLNAAIELWTELSPRALRRALRKLEAELGRENSDERYAPRQIDLDLCLYDDLVFEDEELKLPHPDLVERAYLARSVADLAPNLRHPVSGETMSELAARLEPDAEFWSRPEIRLEVLQALQSSGNGEPRHDLSL